MGPGIWKFKPERQPPALAKGIESLLDPWLHLKLFSYLNAEEATLQSYSASHTLPAPLKEGTTSTGAMDAMPKIAHPGQGLSRQKI